MAQMGCCDYRNLVARQESPTGPWCTAVQVAQRQHPGPGDQPVLHWPGLVSWGGDAFPFSQRPYRLVVALTFPPLTVVFPSNALFLFRVPSVLTGPRLKLQCYSNQLLASINSASVPLHSPCPLPLTPLRLSDLWSELVLWSSTPPTWSILQTAARLIFPKSISPFHSHTFSGFSFLSCMLKKMYN